MDASELFYEDDVTDDSIPAIQKITKQNNTLATWGNQQTMNMNSLIYENIIASPYVKNHLNELATYHQVLDEIYYNVTHLEPWERGTRKSTGLTGMCGSVRGVGAGGVVSTAYCLLYKLFALRLTRKQLVGLINHVDSAYLRGMGFMYIRYTQPPSDLWAWMEAYLDDDEEIDPKAGGGDKMAVAQMCKIMLTKLDWYGTLFPRIPVPIQKEMELKFRERNQKRFLETKERDEARQYFAEERFAAVAAASADRPDDRRRDWRRDDERRDDERRADRSRSSRSRSPRRRSGSDGRGRSPTSRSRRRDDDDGKRRHKSFYKCKHHLRHHHCIKHKSRCPRRARQESKSKQPKA